MRGVGCGVWGVGGAVRAGRGLRHGGGEVGGGRHGRQLRASLLHKLLRDLHTKISFQFGSIRSSLIRSDWIHARTLREFHIRRALRHPHYIGETVCRRSGEMHPNDSRGICLSQIKENGTPLTAGRTVGAGP